MKRLKFTVRPTGQTVRFRCEAKGDQPMKYTWLRNGKPLVFRNRKNRKTMDVHGYSLKVKKLILDDAGNYTCVASNMFGSISFSFFLNMLREYSYFKQFHFGNHQVNKGVDFQGAGGARG